MKKIGILTFHDSDNFGSVLQAYATCAMLRDEGLDGEIIDLRKTEVQQLYRIFKFSKRPHEMIATCYNALHYRALKSRKQRYESFRKKHMYLSEKRYASGAEMVHGAMDYSGYIVGSDQVWNVDIIDYDRAYFLPFADGARRAAYAASFGPVHKEPASLAGIRNDLSMFDLVTVREQMAADMVESLDLPRPNVVPDPVFFLNKRTWLELAAQEKSKKPYMLCYFPGVPTKEFDEFTVKLAKERGLERVLLMPHWRNLFRRARKCYNAGPEEFLALFRDAEVICTNSFHAVAFSIIFEKEFIAGTHAYRSDARINTILDRTGLARCELHNGEYSCLKADVKKAAQIMFEEAEKSKNVLLNVIQQ